MDRGHGWVVRGQQGQDCAGFIRAGLARQQQTRRLAERFTRFQRKVVGVFGGVDLFAGPRHVGANLDFLHAVLDGQDMRLAFPGIGQRLHERGLARTSRADNQHRRLGAAEQSQQVGGRAIHRAPSKEIVECPRVAATTADHDVRAVGDGRRDRHVHARAVGQRQALLGMVGVQGDAEQVSQQLGTAGDVRFRLKALVDHGKGAANLLHHDRGADDLDLGNRRVVEVALGRAPADGLSEDLLELVHIGAETTENTARHAGIGDRGAQHRGDRLVAGLDRGERVEKLSRQAGAQQIRCRAENHRVTGGGRRCVGLASSSRRQAGFFHYHRQRYHLARVWSWSQRHGWVSFLRCSGYWLTTTGRCARSEACR